MKSWQNYIIYPKFEYYICSHSYKKRSHGVMVSTLDFESSDPSSNLGGTYIFFKTFLSSHAFLQFSVLQKCFFLLLHCAAYSKYPHFFQILLTT